MDGLVGASRGSRLALASLILGLLSLPLSLLSGVPAIVSGHLALSRIARSQRTLRGKGMAVAGLILGYLSIIVLASALVMVIRFPSKMDRALLLLGRPSLELVLRAEGDAAGTAPSADTLSQTASVLRRRLDGMGFPGEVQLTPPNRLTVRLVSRGPDPAARTKRLLLSQGNLSFRFVHAQSEDLAMRMQDPGFSAPSGYTPLPELESSGSVPKTLFVREESVLTGARIRSVRATHDESGQPCIFVSFDDAGAAALGRATEADVGLRLAIVLDEVVLSAPMILGPIGGEAQIAGGFTESQAREIADVLSGGALPCRLVLVSERSRGPGSSAEAGHP